MLVKYCQLFYQQFGISIKGLCFKSGALKSGRLNHLLVLVEWKQNVRGGFFFKTKLLPQSDIVFDSKSKGRILAL